MSLFRRDGRRQETMSLTAEHVSFRYDARRESAAEFALHDVSVAVQRGSLTGLLGPNGCGKTTLLRLMAGVLQPGQGSVTLNGRSLREIPRRELARQVAVVPQETHPAFDYTVLEMTLMGRHPHLGLMQLEGPDDIAIAHESLAATGTADLAHRAFAQSSSVLLLDEPTASLDLAYQLEVASLLSRLNRDRGVTMVLATHDLNLAAALCDSLVLLRAGRVIAQGPPRDVLTAPLVQQLYNVEADVRFHDAAGHLTVVPIRRAR